MSNKKFYLSTPIYYVNAKPHIGSTYTTVLTDILARYHRSIGDKTFFLTGTDEHGTKIEKAALQENKKPQEFVDQLSGEFKKCWEELNISFDNFIRTTDPKHIQASQKALNYLYEKGFIYKGEYEGLYCVGCEQYKTEKDLINGKCPDHDKEPQIMKESCYMFKLSAFRGELLKAIKSKRLEIIPRERENEVLSFLENNNLSDISCSRKNLKWGIELPWDKSHTAYVWMEAFLNYLTGLGWNGDPAKLPEMWPADLQIMAKDILRVHATIWPAILLALGLELPKKIYVHGYFLVEGQKMSKSIGNVISPDDLVKRYGVDASRYLLAASAGMGSDGDISWQKFDEKYNADLANGLGNLVSRVVSVVIKNYQGIVPKVDISKTGKSWINKNVMFSSEEVNRPLVWKSYQKLIDEYKFERVLELIWLSINKTNREENAVSISSLDQYINYHKIWEKKGEHEIVVYNILESLRHIAWMLSPFMPETSKNIWVSLGINTEKELNKKFIDAIKWGGLEPNTNIKKINPLFPRLNK